MNTLADVFDFIHYNAKGRNVEVAYCNVSLMHYYIVAGQQRAHGGLVFSTDVLPPQCALRAVWISGVNKGKRLWSNPKEQEM